jgi:phosphoserine aminotransferase
MKIHNFSAGPSILPKSVLEQASKAVLDFNDSGLSLVEISHRSKDFVQVMERARALVKELLNVPETHEVVFLQGGASLGFLIAGMNFLPEGGLASYLDTGTWSSKAIKEVKLLGEVDVVASSKDANYNYIPKNYTVDKASAYLHLTSNNTIFGTQIQEFPDTETPLICDMSSDIFSRSIDVSKFDLIYAGAQKNMGPAGTTLYIVNKNKLGKTGRKIPSMLDLNTHIDKDSMFNTPPVFAVYTSMLTLEWIKENGGVDAIQKRNSAKAEALYSEIDANPKFVGHAKTEDRSHMNVTFNLTNPADTERFDELCAQNGISGLKGHRSVGGYRASIYNALDIDSVEVLIQTMKAL